MSETTFDPTKCPLCPEPTPAGPVGTCERHERLIHAATGVVGRVKKVHAPGEWKGPNDRAVTQPVVELADGNAFLVEPGAFAALTAPQMRLYGRLVAELGTAIARSLGHEPIPASREERDASKAIVRAALSAVLRRLDVAGRDVSSHR